jgi:hypothetical protein
MYFASIPLENSLDLTKQYSASLGPDWEQDAKQPKIAAAATNIIYFLIS